MKKLTIAFLLFFQVLFGMPAEAGSIGRAMQSNTVTTAKWSVIATATGQSNSSGPLSLTWTVNSGNAYSYFSFLNNGTLPITQFSASVTQTQVSGSGKPNDVSFTLCQNGIWNVVTNSCSGTPILIGNASDLTFLVAASNLNVNSELKIQATTKPNTKNVYLTEISTSVGRSSVRSGVVSNS